MRRWEQQGGDNGRDEQRRRQNEYHAALAEQVRLQEAKKLAERQDRLASQQIPQRGGGGSDNGPQVQGGLFAGLGQNHTVGKNTYARGHHVEKMTAELKKQGQPQPQEPPSAAGEPTQPPYAAYNGGHGGPPPAHYNEPPRMNPPHEQHQYHQLPPYPPPQQQTGGYPEYHQGGPPDTTSQYYHQPPQQSFPQQGYHQGGYDQPHQTQGQYPPNQPFLPMPPPPHGATNHPSPPPPSQLQHQQPPSSSHGRRHQVSATSSGDPSRRNAQMEAQSFLKQQMEDNQRRKVEAKRKKDEEERAEMQRVEKELKLQAEAFEAEKRAKVKEAAAKQQQLENDLRLKQEEELKKTNPKLRHKNVHDDPAPVASNQPPPPLFPPDGQSPALPPFGTPREPQGYEPHPHQFTPRDNQPPWQHQQFQPMQMPPPHNPMDQGYSNLPPQYQPHPGGFPGDAYPPQMFPPNMAHAPSMAMIPPMQMQPTPSMSHFMDARLQMLANELASQRALVEQLVHQAPPSARGTALTAGDFDKLRREMQAELDRRDAMHKQELDALKSQAAGAIERTPSTRHLPLNDNHGASPAQDPSPQKPFPGDKGSHDSRSSLPPARASLGGGQDADDHTFVSNSPHKPFPGANGQYNIQRNAAKDRQLAANSPHKPFPGATGQYNVHGKGGQPVVNAAATTSSDHIHEGSSFVSTSPHKAFPGANGQYNLHGNTARQERQAPANPPPPKSVPGSKGQHKSQPARRSNNSSDENSPGDDTAFASDSPHKPFPGATGQYKLSQGTAQTQRSRPPAIASIESNQDEERPFVSTSLQKPFPGANGQYNIQASATTGKPVRGPQQPSSKSPEAKAYPGGSGIHTLTHQRSPRRRQVHDAESPQKPSRASRVPGQPSRASHQPSPPRSTWRSGHAADAASSPTREDLRPSQPSKATLDQATKLPFAVVNLLEGSLDGPASHFVASNNDNVTLKCESTMIYFDGVVDAHQVPASQPNQVGATDISALSPRFAALFAGKDHSSSVHAQDNQLDQPLAAAPPSIPASLVTIDSPDSSFQVHEVAPPASWQCLRYACDESLSLNGCDGSFDIDALYEKNTTRRNLLEQLEQRTASAPHHVEDLVATFRAISSQKSTRPTAQDEVRTTSKWVGDSAPKWLPRRS